MAFPVTFYYYSKPENSTAIPPADTQKLELQCNLKSPASIVSPILEISGDLTPFIYTYAYIPRFNRYYFVTDWTWSAGVWLAHLSNDVMATFRDDIGEHSQYIARSQAESDMYIVDSAYPTKARPQVITQNHGRYEDFTFDLSEGTYILGAIGANENCMGSVTYYVFDPENFGKFMNYLFGRDSTWFPDLQEITAALGKLLFNPMQYIVSCIWLPFKYTAFTEADYVTLGFTRIVHIDETAFFGYLAVPTVSVPYKVLSPVFLDPVPSHPDSGEGKFYLNYAPTTRRILHWPVLGDVELDANLIDPGDYIGISARIDLVSGLGYFTVATYPYAEDRDRKAVLFETVRMVALPIQLSQTGADFKGLIDSAQGFAEAIQGKDVAEGFTSIVNATNSLATVQNTVYSNSGSPAIYSEPIILESQFYRLADTAPETLGRPLCSDRLPKDIPGYIQTLRSKPVLGVHASCQPLAEEYERVRAMMDGGFFYE